jgi:hypothetical protein
MEYEVKVEFTLSIPRGSHPIPMGNFSLLYKMVPAYSNRFLFFKNTSVFIKTA